MIHRLVCYSQLKLQYDKVVEGLIFDRLMDYSPIFRGRRALDQIFVFCFFFVSEMASSYVYFLLFHLVNMFDICKISGYRI